MGSEDDEEQGESVSEGEGAPKQKRPRSAAKAKSASKRKPDGASPGEKKLTGFNKPVRWATAPSLVRNQPRALEVGEGISDRALWRACCASAWTWFHEHPSRACCKRAQTVSFRRCRLQGHQESMKARIPKHLGPMFHAAVLC